MEEYKVPVEEEFMGNGRHTSDVNHARTAVAATANSARERCLPVLQANQDVFSVLATYIDMTGKKVDKAVELQDKLKTSGSKRAVELAGEMEPKTKDLESKHKELLQFQTDAVLDAGTPPKRTALL
ncbi:unnamed protein product [Symbiodinium sp. CCMP2456]|nr:unnamed protein product [Symbiodinium sp. CCMP2456]